LTESWGNETIVDAEMCFPSYVLLRRDRANKNKVKGGGVLLYVRECLGAVLDVDSCGNVCESLWIKIQSKARRDLYIGVCYRSPTEPVRKKHMNFSLMFKNMLNIQH